MLVLVVVLDLWDLGAEKRARFFGNNLFHHSDREISRILEHEQEHEHDLSTSAFGFKATLEKRALSQRDSMIATRHGGIVRRSRRPPSLYELRRARKAGKGRARAKRRRDSAA